ncbi:SCO family protein [Thiohalorhabdus sp. Cl-TMA]|uniref:SCO family protein n=1 Tax=Thiohalorhabdus methylotrophus TaxID=3242694 RepID=A0ABV4TTA0_9GAMM
MSASTQTPNGGSRLQLWLLLVVFFGPVILAGLLYANADRWLGHTGTGHHGQLFDPARPLQGLPVQDQEGERFGIDFLHGKWTLLYIGPADCGDACRTDLYGIRQAHKAQGKNIGRVQRLFIARGGPVAAETRSFLAEQHPHMRVARVAPGKTLDGFRGDGPSPSVGGLYLVDPNANLVLRYGTGASPDGIIEDLEALLKHSTIG